ncbi:unnamed protein product [Phytomonas sp. Hart1]|nr:unnamed protein product [Phytomonas sp. Hart1]|eukprot:CCW66071.1 unnamed protein product [Phytomonas sp. isolate Hart1]
MFSTRSVRCFPSRPFLLLFFFLSILLIFKSEVEAFPTFGGHSHDELYRDLGLSTYASKADIRSAFRRLARECHPDLKDGFEAKDAAKLQMAKVLRAYEILSDEAKKLQYDQTGVIPGEPFNPQGTSVDDMFVHFHQPVPIFSKTMTLESEALLERILAFRGARLFVFQVYDDHCKQCRAFSTVWEAFRLTSIVEAGLVEMLRIDAKSSEGAALLSKLKIKYSGSPMVFLYVDGSKWPFHALAKTLGSGSNRQVYQELQNFIMGFFQDGQSAIREIGDDQTSAVLNFLHEPRPVERPMRVLLPRYLSLDFFPVTLRMRYGNVDIAQVPRDLMLHLIERCELKIDLRNSFGEKVEVPAFIILSQQEVPILGNSTDSLGSLASCEGLHVGASIALTYKKAAEFVGSFVPPPHPDMGDLTYLDSMNFYQICKENCLVWVRRDCGPGPSDVFPPDPDDDSWAIRRGDASPPEQDADVQKMVALLKRDYYSFKTGYMCANQQPFLSARFPELAMFSGPFLFAIQNSNDGMPYWFSHPARMPFSALNASMIDRGLSELMSEDDEMPKEAIPIPGPRITTLFPTQTFPISKKQWYFHMFANLDSTIGSVFGGIMPFVIMYLVHTKIINPAQDRENPTRGTTSGATSTSSEPYRISIFTPADVREAKGGSGFLILIFDKRADSGRAFLPQTNLARDPRLTLRVVSSAQDQWRRWMKELTANGTNNNTERNGQELELYVLAICKSKMKAVAKPRGQGLDSFFGDLLKGKLPVTEELPGWALQ